MYEGFVDEYEEKDYLPGRKTQKFARIYEEDEARVKSDYHAQRQQNSSSNCREVNQNAQRREDLGFQLIRRPTKSNDFRTTLVDDLQRDDRHRRDEVYHDAQRREDLGFQYARRPTKSNDFRTTLVDDFQRDDRNRRRHDVDGQLSPNIVDSFCSYLNSGNGNNGKEDRQYRGSSGHQHHDDSDDDKYRLMKNPVRSSSYYLDK